MKRSSLNFWVDGVAAVLMVGMIATGLVIRFVLPAGSGSRLELWGLNRHGWGDWHFWLAVGLGGVVLVHVALHWAWVWAVGGRLARGGEVGGAAARPHRAATWGVALGLMLALVLWGGMELGRRQVREAAGSSEGGDHGMQRRGGVPVEAEDGEEVLRGSMTLAEAAVARGIPIEALRRRLNLPEGVQEGERLGRVCREQGMSMAEARRRLMAP
ncbi:MAG: DUF4405 domain-containing protein [Verrucomicrobiae bacterium]|nr:DUF4405 domain-containing protein [Verrucomicrobiae bacterium]